MKIVINKNIKSLIVDIFLLDELEIIFPPVLEERVRDMLLTLFCK